ncbi:plant intracellular Ras-group-related LRR protein 6-like [Impatiens glandulifera]|uniref:plant intracellular Ras-group-related LRR protein 6-like n=1 Tax=Impatiens glandulifera TaxID=253017 RepID=UPI001FB18941|nr:plant intracellular Ras-group-related LRR protein 6-like [Impatiens glandulifera]XP_047338969.1 plant intracellular Ras-group-related LRR protein 6-like [Impatiens glandulifera]
MGEIRKEKHWQLFWLCVVDLFLNKSKTFRFPSMDRFLKDARASGSLNLSNRSLSEVPNEVYKSMDAIGGSEKWWETVELQKLILAHNNIESLREDLRNLPLLSVLNVRHNKLTLLPAAIGELHMLKSLDVSFNMISSIPEEIGSATALVKFECSNNQLKDLLGSIGRCSDLSEFKWRPKRRSSR